MFNLGRAVLTVIKVSNSESLNSEEVYLVEEKSPKELHAHLIPVLEKDRIYLSDQEASLFKKFLQKRVATFADPNGRLGQTTLREHHIVLDEERPFKEASRNMSLFKRDILIEKSHSPWSSQLVLVQKKDKTWRVVVCVDYQRLNSVPRIDDNLDEGDIVRRFQLKQIVGTKLKLDQNWTGPWIITKNLSDVLFEIKHSRKSNPVIVHADNIKSFQIRKTAALK